MGELGWRPGVKEQFIMYSVQTAVIRGIEIVDGQFMGSEVIKQRLLSCVFRTFLFKGGGGHRGNNTKLNKHIHQTFNWEE